MRIVRERLTAFVVGGFVSGIAGVLYGHFLGTLRVESFYLDLTFLLITMLVVGGMRSLAGAVRSRGDWHLRAYGAAAAA